MSDTSAYDLFISYSRRDNLARRVSDFVVLLRDGYRALTNGDDGGAAPGSNRGDEAKALLKQAIDILGRSVGSDHPVTSQVIENAALIR